MYGLAAIQQANGWAMAGAGACIVMCGLAILSFLISMLPRIVDFFEPKVQSVPTEIPQEEPTGVIVPETMPNDINAAATIYMALTEDLGETFSLVELHRKSKELGLPHPHLSICQFRDAAILTSVEDGIFSWKPSSE